jgi:uncharacterized Ntn-hydrolase superfamily protein
MPTFQPNGALVMPQASASYIIPFKLLDLIEEGATFDDLHEEAKLDKHYLISQIGVIKSNKEMWVYTGPDCKDAKRHIQGPDYIVMGNALAGDQVFEAMEAAFVDSSGEPLHERLMRSIEAGCLAGGQAVEPYGHIPELWSMLLVLDGTERPLVDLRVDYDVDAVGKLRQYVEDIVPLGEFYDIMIYDHDKFLELMGEEDTNLEMKLFWRDTGSKE